MGGNHEPVTSANANILGNSKCHTRGIHGQEIHRKTMNLKPLYRKVLIHTGEIQGRKVLIHAGEIHGDTMNLQLL